MDPDRPLDDQESSALLRFARETLEASCAGRPLPTSEGLSGRLLDPGATFVTIERRDGSLRGCIGMIEPVESLARSVQEMTIAAAHRDPRFPPVEAHELDDLRLSLSVMHPSRPLSSIDEIVIGRHGLIVERGARKGLLLPQVAERLGWDRETFLDQTCAKAGLEKGCWRDPSTRVELFAADVYGR